MVQKRRIRSHSVHSLYEESHRNRNRNGTAIDLNEFDPYSRSFFRTSPHEVNSYTFPDSVDRKKDRIGNILTIQHLHSTGIINTCVRVTELSKMLAALAFGRSSVTRGMMPEIVDRRSIVHILKNRQLVISYILHQSTRVPNMFDELYNPTREKLLDGRYTFVRNLKDPLRKFPPRKRNSNCEKCNPSSSIDCHSSFRGVKKSAVNLSNSESMSSSTQKYNIDDTFPPNSKLKNINIISTELPIEKTSVESHRENYIGINICNEEDNGNEFVNNIVIPTSNTPIVPLVTISTEISDLVKDSINCETVLDVIKSDDIHLHSEVHEKDIAVNHRRPMSHENEHKLDSSMICKCEQSEYPKSINPRAKEIWLIKDCVTGVLRVCKILSKIFLNLTDQYSNIGTTIKEDSLRDIFMLKLLTCHMMSEYTDKFLEAYHDDMSACFVFEYFDGGDLLDYMATRAMGLQVEATDNDKSLRRLNIARSTSAPPNSWNRISQSALSVESRGMTSSAGERLYMSRSLIDNPPYRAIGESISLKTPDRTRLGTKSDSGNFLENGVEQLSVDTLSHSRSLFRNSSCAAAYLNENVSSANNITVARLNVREMYEIIKCVSGALELLHSLHLVHLDVSPEQILVMLSPTYKAGSSDEEDVNNVPKNTCLSKKDAQKYTSELDDCIKSQRPSNSCDVKISSGPNGKRRLFRCVLTDLAQVTPVSVLKKICSPGKKTDKTMNRTTTSGSSKQGNPLAKTGKALYRAPEMYFTTSASVLYHRPARVFLVSDVFSLGVSCLVACLGGPLWSSATSCDSGYKRMLIEQYDNHVSDKVILGKESKDKDRQLHSKEEQNITHLTTLSDSEKDDPSALESSTVESQQNLMDTGKWSSDSHHSVHNENIPIHGISVTPKEGNHYEPKGGELAIQQRSLVSRIPPLTNRAVYERLIASTIGLPPIVAEVLTGMLVPQPHLRWSISDILNSSMMKDPSIRNSDILCDTEYHQTVDEIGGYLNDFQEKEYGGKVGNFFGNVLKAGSNIFASVWSVVCGVMPSSRSINKKRENPKILSDNTNTTKTKTSQEADALANPSEMNDTGNEKNIIVPNKPENKSDSYCMGPSDSQKPVT